MQPRLLRFPFCILRAQFENHDVLAVYSRDGECGQVFGYQLEEGKANPKQPTEAGLTKSFVIKGSAPAATTGDENGWSISNGTVIETIFGNSGMHWTSREWSRLIDTCGQKSE